MSTCHRHGNVEPISRSICARELKNLHAAPDRTPALIDRYWPVIAAELVAGLRDDDGKIIPHSVLDGLTAWENWLDGI